MIHPLVGLLGTGLPLLLGAVSVQTEGAHLGFGQHVDASTVPPALSVGESDAKSDATTKMSPMLVKLTPVQTEPQYTRLASALDSTSRTAISGIPGVTILGDDDDEFAFAKKSRKRVVVLSGKLRDIVTTKEGDDVVIRAQVEYIIYRIPGRDIAAVVDGAAKTKISAVQVKTKESRQQVEDDVAAAAVESAARRAPAALLAISKR
jgi:hypothetical protein